MDGRPAVIPALASLDSSPLTLGRSLLVPPAVEEGPTEHQEAKHRPEGAPQGEAAIQAADTKSESETAHSGGHDVEPGRIDQSHPVSRSLRGRGCPGFESPRTRPGALG